MSEGHALLSASSAARWLNCPPSARLAAKAPDTTSAYAAEGSLAHALAELKLRKHFVEPMGARTYNARLKRLQADPAWQDEMQRYTDGYLDYVKDLAMQYPQRPLVAVEQRLDYSDWVRDGFGTGDCVLLGGGVLQIVDLKYGKGVSVSAERNPQMMLYALGAIGRYRAFYGIDTVRLTIYQPRLDNISRWETTPDELIRWGEEVARPAADLAYQGAGELRAGDWCRFCPVRARCRARCESYFALEPLSAKAPDLLADAEIGDALRRAQGLKGWVADLEEYALSAALAGRDIPGWKAVEGRSTRQWDDQDAAFAALAAAGVDEALLYERRPITLAAAEKLLGKAAFAEIASNYVLRPPGKPTLVPETDPRAPIHRDAAQLFATN